MKILPILINKLFIFALILFSYITRNSTTAYCISPATSEALPLKSPSVVTGAYLIQLFFSLIIVFGIMYLISKYILPKIKTTTKGKLIEVIDRVGLEPQVSAYILKVKDSSWLVVASNKNVSVISKLEQDQ